jgi:short-subunit dehydrogenase
MASLQRIVWVTGASSGIGRAVAEEFAVRGDTVAASARSREGLEGLQAACREKKGACEVFPCDVTDATRVSSVGQAIETTLGPVNVLINNAGATSFKEVLATTVEEFDAIVNTNLRGLFLATKAVLPSMLNRGNGLIINVLSYAAKATYTGSGAYAASKAGAEALMNVLRAETRDKGIKIVNVFPGAVLTPIWHPKHQDRYGSRMMRPQEIARVLYDLSCQPPSMMIEDIVIRPQIGDLKV